MAFNHAQRPGRGDVDSVVKAIQQDFPAISRSDVTDSVSDFLAVESSERAERVLSQLSKFKDEAKQDANLRRAIDGFREQVADGVFSDTHKRTPAETKAAIRALRNLRDQTRRERDLSSQIKDLEQQLKEDDFPAPRARLAKITNKKIESLVFERDSIKRQIRSRMSQLRPKGVLDYLAEPFNLSRSIVTAVDYSALFTQGAPLSAGNPLIVPAALAEMVKASFSERLAFKAQQAIQNRPNAGKYELAQIDFTDSFGNTTKREEEFAGIFVTKDGLTLTEKFVPGVRASGRAHGAFLNRLRADAFDVMADSLPRNREPTVTEMRLFGRYINIASGRGDLGRLAPVARELNAAFFAPKYLASAYQYVTLKSFRGANPFIGPNKDAGRVIAKQHLRTLAGFSTFVGLGVLAGATVEFDPTSSDFLKLRFGRIRLGVGAGITGMIVIINKILIFGESKSATTGNTIPLRGEDASRTDGFFEFATFFRKKFSPGASLAVDLALTGKNVIGDPINVTTVEGVKNIGKSLVVPMSLADINEVTREVDVPDNVFFSIFSIFGASISVFDAPDQ